MVRLSRRMEAVAALVTANGVLADIGTDHAYVPIALVERGRIRRAIALDIGEGPLSRARENIAAHGLEGRIETRLSDGTAALAPGEADIIVIAGMGGELMLRILAAGFAVCDAARELILQPQSEIAKVREYLRLHGWRITAEDMVLEDGKYYPMFRVVCNTPTGHYSSRRESAWQVLLEDQYGPLLLRDQNPVLRSYLEKERKTLREILERLFAQPESEAIRERMAEVQRKLALNERALHHWE